MVEEATEKINNGFILKGSDNPFYEGTIGLRKSGVTFNISKAELDEYVKCKLDIHHFAENYCWIKGERGDPVIVKLRDYQKEILDNFFNNRFNILMASRQVGKCLFYNALLTIEMESIKMEITIGNLYYMLISSKRKLTFLEKCKIKLYNILFKIETVSRLEGKP